MRKLKVLDCTLRDGGYCNEWRFGRTNIKKIIEGLTESGVDVIECGFLTNKKIHEPDITKFNRVEELAEFVPKDRHDKIYTCMINYGEYVLDEIADFDGKSIDALRIAFHKKDRIPALEFCRGVKEKGYKCFVQAMVSLSYSDEEFLDLLKRVNEIKPYAFYIVDSFGTMKRKELIRLFYTVEYNLSDEIAVGWHSHNNMQLSYANAQTLADIHTKKDIIIDASIHGMGRGAGNLNTELFLDYLNDNFGVSYNLKPILNIVDEIISPFYERVHWGYSLPNYISARHNAHPNYARYFSEKQTLTFENMDEIFEMMDYSKRVTFNEKYAESLYVEYMSKGEIFLEHESDLKKFLFKKKVLLIAPGKSVSDEKQKIVALVESKNFCVISVNYEYPFAATDFIFVSNIRRYREIAEDKRFKCIVTSNIPSTQVYFRADYKKLLEKESSIIDNAGLMAIRFLISFGVKEVYLAGFDGYSYDIEENYINDDMGFVMRRAVIDVRNNAMKEALKILTESIKIEFVTPTRYSFTDSPVHGGGGGNSLTFA